VPTDPPILHGDEPEYREKPQDAPSVVWGESKYSPVPLFHSWATGQISKRVVDEIP